MTDEEVQEERPLSETELCVKYTDTANMRLMNRWALSGVLEGDPGEDLVWTPGSEVPYSKWLDYAGSEERAQEVLSQHSHEFVLVGPGADDIEGPEEFSFEEKEN